MPDDDAPDLNRAARAMRHLGASFAEAAAAMIEFGLAMPQHDEEGEPVSNAAEITDAAIARAKVAR